MSSDFLPYLILLFAIITAWTSSIRCSFIVLVAAVVTGLIVGRLTWVSLPFIFLLGISPWLPNHLRLNGNLRIFCYCIFLLLAIGLTNFLIPGFNNLPVYQNARLSSDSVPFTMYLNFDKALVGFMIMLFFTRVNSQRLSYDVIKIAFPILLTLVCFVLLIAFSVHYIRFDPKLPALTWVWLLNNLFFVCLAEEGLYRGLIQTGFEKLLPKTKWFSYSSVVLSAAIFGSAHYKGGLTSIFLATFAGLFYGYAFLKSRRLETSILVHFGLNLIHFLFFSYPSLSG